MRDQPIDVEYVVVHERRQPQPAPAWLEPVLNWGCSAILWSIAAYGVGQIIADALRSLA
jgi:hypothetical protein